MWCGVCHASVTVKCNVCCGDCDYHLSYQCDCECDSLCERSLFSSLKNIPSFQRHFSLVVYNNSAVIFLHESLNTLYLLWKSVTCIILPHTRDLSRTNTEILSKSDVAKTLNRKCE